MFYTRVFNSFLTEVPIIQKPVQLFAKQINDWFRHDRDLRHERIKSKCLCKIFMKKIILPVLNTEHSGFGAIFDLFT